MNNTVEQDQSTTEESEKSELDYVRDQAREKIEAYLADPNLSTEQKAELLASKIAVQKDLLVRYSQDEERDIQDYRDQYDRLANTPAHEQYNDEWLDKSITEIQGRYAQWRLEVDVIISLLEEAREKIEPEPESEPVIEESEESAPPIEKPEEPKEPVKEKPAEKPEEPKSEELKKIDAETKLDEIKLIAARNRELAEDIKNILVHAHIDISNVSPRAIYARRLQNFEDDHIRPLRGEIEKIFDQADRIRQTGNLFTDNNPRAEAALDEGVAELKQNWHTLNRRLEESVDVLIRMRRQTEEATGDSLDRDDPLMRVGYNLYRAKETYTDKVRSLFME